MRILFVCTGNTCRSPMAQYLMRFWAEQSLKDLEVLSAGIAAVSGQPMSKYARQALEQNNIPYDDHYATQLNAELIRSCDLILCMTKGHQDRINSMFEGVKHKVKTLSSKDVFDPYGQDLKAYLKCFDEIQKALEVWIKEFKGESR